MKATGGKAIYGAAVGILMLEARFPRILGDMGNALTWPFPVHYRIVRGASPDRVVRRGAEGTLDAFIADAIRFTDMAGVVEGVLDRLSGLGGLEKPAESLDMVLDMDRTARRLAREAMRLPAAAERT